MGYTNKSRNRRWGLPVSIFTLILWMVLLGTVSAPTPAFAKAILCGQCHSNPPRDTDGCATVYKNHSTHTVLNALATCDRCHPTTSTVQATLKHNNNISNITSVLAIGLRYSTSTAQCTKACHRNRDDSYWGTNGLTCNACHFRSGAYGNYSMSGLHVRADRAWKHYSSAIKVKDNKTTILCTNCHPNADSDTGRKKAHVNTTSFVKRANMGAAHNYVNVTSIIYTKGATAAQGKCSGSCHYNAGDPFGNRTIYFKPGQKKRFGGYSTAKWGDTDLKCNECHSTPSQEATFQAGTSIRFPGATSTTESRSANKRHDNHMFRYKLNPWNFQGQDRNIYCDDCHRAPDFFATRGFLHHSTLGYNNSKVISLPVKSQYARVYLQWRNNGVGRDGTTPAAFNTVNGGCTNVYCHTIMQTGLWTEQACDSCHGKLDGVNVGSGAPGYTNITTKVVNTKLYEDYTGGGGAHYTHVTKRGYPCRTCHVTGGGDGDPTKHHNISQTVAKGNVDIGFTSQYFFNNVSSKYDWRTRSCNNVKCHYGASQNWDCTPLH